MKELVRCKPCGFIVEKHKLGEVCPACGAKSKFFEPYREKISKRRKFLLDLDLHPISVHFPQFVVSIIPLLIGYTFVFPSSFPNEIQIIMRFLALIYPFSVVGAMLTGLFDAKIRYKKIIKS